LHPGLHQLQDNDNPVLHQLMQHPLEYYLAFHMVSHTVPDRVHVGASKQQQDGLGTTPSTCAPVDMADCSQADHIGST
jgi:hypothetical protein